MSFSHNKFSIPVGVHLLLKNPQNNHILLMKRHATGYDDGIWSFPAGAIDGGESLRTALCREAMEEIGIDLQEDQLQFLGIVHKLESDNYENIAIFFLANEWRGEPINKEPHKCSALEWFDPQNPPANISPACLFFLQKWQSSSLPFDACYS